MNTLKNIHEGFFKNVGATCDALERFLSANASKIIVLKGKEYIVNNRTIYSVDAIKSGIYNLLDRSNIKHNEDNVMYNEVLDLHFDKRGVCTVIYKFYGRSNIANGSDPYKNYMMIPDVTGVTWGNPNYDKKLGEFLKSISD